MAQQGGFVVGRQDASPIGERLDELDLMVVHVLAEASLPGKHDGSVPISKRGMDGANARMRNDDVRSAHFLFKLRAGEHRNAPETEGADLGGADLANAIERARPTQKRGVNRPKHAIEGLKRIADGDE